MVRKPIESDIAWSTPDKIVIHGLNLCDDIVGKIDLGQMSFLQVFGRLPSENENRMFNAIMVVLMEHGITPSSLATRLTYCGAPEAVQAAVAAGLLGLGSVFVGSLDNAARILQEAIPDPASPGDPNKIARDIVTQARSRKELIPGIGHPFHKPIDPRAPKLFQIAEETGFSGPYIDLINAIGREAEQQYKRSLPVNVTGAMAAIASQFKIPWQVCRGLAVAARAMGLVGHIIEEMRNPMAEEIYFRIEKEASAHLHQK